MTTTFAGCRVLAGILEMPRIGAWVADIEVDADEAPPAWIGKLTLSIDEALSLVGTVFSSTTFAGRASLRVVGGAGGLGMPVTARDYLNAPARIPLADALTEGGETLSVTSDPYVLASLFDSWTRATGTVGDAIALIARELGVAWRVLPDGSVWLGDETWPPSEAKDLLVFEDDGREGRLAAEAIAPNILPGTVLEGRKLSRVTIRFTADSHATTLLTEEREAPRNVGDRIFDSLSRLVNRAMSRVDYHALYAARVVAQNADGTLDILPDDPRMPSKAKVPVRAGLPGVRVKVAPGARVHLGFSNGDPKKPIAALWEHDGMTELQMGGTSPVVRQGDLVSISLPPGFTFTAASNGLLSPVGPVTGVGVFTIVAAPVPLSGIAITGSGKVKA